MACGEISVETRQNSRRQVAMYLLFVFAFSLLFWFLMFGGHRLGGGARYVVQAREYDGAQVSR